MLVRRRASAQDLLAQGLPLVSWNKLASTFLSSSCTLSGWISLERERIRNWIKILLLPPFQLPWRNDVKKYQDIAKKQSEVWTHASGSLLMGHMAATMQHRNNDVLVQLVYYSILWKVCNCIAKLDYLVCDCFRIEYSNCCMKILAKHPYLWKLNNGPKCLG